MHKECSGFTLLELVLVLVVVGVLSVNLTLRWPADDELKLPAQAELFASHLRHAQALAMFWAEPLRLTVTTNNYSVACVTASILSPCNNSPVIDPATAQAFSVALESGLSFTSVSVTDFDVLGRPVSGGSIINSSPLPARTFILQAGTPTWTVNLQPLTGFVSSSP